ncbi:hypothetical protein RUM43_010897 [Polyplax serrata]|uniref:Uncharacterized protein n=1 Tax=Polyplax serrata TaxID=468196 RepID=A0AAN8NL58_POLSC
MRLTTVLCRWKKALPGGNIWKGKHRLYKKVTPLHVAKKAIEFELEEENMFYLRNPYLSPEQAIGYATYELAPSNPEEIKLQEIKEKGWKLDRHLCDRFGYLKITDKWE